MSGGKSALVLAELDGDAAWVISLHSLWVRHVHPGTRSDYEPCSRVCRAALGSWQHGRRHRSALCGCLGSWQRQTQQGLSYTCSVPSPQSPNMSLLLPWGAKGAFLKSHFQKGRISYVSVLDRKREDELPFQQITPYWKFCVLEVSSSSDSVSKPASLKLKFLNRKSWKASIRFKQDKDYGSGFTCHIGP